MSWWDSIVWASPDWRTPSLALGVLAGVAVLAAYLGIRGQQRVRIAAAVLKAVALAALLLCLLEPMRREERPRPGANLFVVLADNSRSLTLRDASGDSVQQQLETALADEAWQTRLGQDFDVRRYQFDSRLRSTGDWQTLDFDGARSSLAAALQGVGERFEGQPVAGILLLSDGNATDQVDLLLERGDLPPIYPVRFRQGEPAADALVQRVSVRQTNFEDAPVSITADVAAIGFDADTKLKVELLNAENEVLDETFAQPPKGEASAVELKVRPASKGLKVYRLKVTPEGDASQKESTLANNQRLVLVNRRGGEYRLLYVAGRPNWEFKFLRRAIEEDSEEIKMVGLLRIARKEPKFVFRDRDTGDENQFFQGFDGKDEDDTEQYDQPVIWRTGLKKDNPNELRDGFPRDAETLFGFHAIILDDLEARFFDEDQLSLIQEFVSQRGGALLMLGGASSLASGGYERTPLGDMLPVYLDDSQQPASSDVRYRWKLSREGWLQPWVRMRNNEAEERQRIGKMPPFETVNVATRIKPGATVLASVLVEGAAGEGPAELPALAAQRYGKGRAAALLVGDYWKWAMAREDDGRRDLEKSWRQMVRYLISDTPARVEAVAQLQPGGRDVRLRMDVRDEAYRPLDNAEVKLTVTAPGGREVELRAAAAKQAGVYETTFAHREAGPYLVHVTATGPDGHPIGEAETGWSHEPDADEFQSLQINQELLDRLAAETEGEVAPGRRLERFVTGIATRRAVVNETWMRPLWHRWYIFLFAALCLAGEWGLRRYHGLP